MFLGAISATGLAMSVLLAAREVVSLVSSSRTVRFVATMSGSRVAMLGAVLMLAGVALTSRTRPATVATAMGAAALFVGVFVDRRAAAAATLRTVWIMPAPAPMAGPRSGDSVYVG